MCNVDSAEAEPLTFYTEKLTKARLRYHCYECHRVISPGEHYLYAKGLYEGTWEQYRICSHCRIGIQWLQIECGGFVFGGVQEDLYEHLSEPVCSLSLAKLVVGMRRQWKRFNAEMLMAVPQMPRVTI